MEIEQFRVVLRAKSFDRTCRFYGESLALPRLGNWEREDGRGALYLAGAAVIEVLGRPDDRPAGRDEAFEYQGPQHKMTLTFMVPSAQGVYDELFFRDKNIPGGLRRDAEGNLLFETHDPDGVKILYREAGS